MSPVKAKPEPSSAPTVAYNTNLRAPITTVVGEAPKATVHARCEKENERREARGGRGQPRGVTDPLPPSSRPPHAPSTSLS